MKAYNQLTFQKYYVHFETKNVSFLKMAAMLDSQGIENKFFFLALYDKGLRDVDPFDPYLSDELRLRVFRECASNRWYFYREVFRIPEAGTSTEPGGGTSFKLNRGNLAYLWCADLNISSYLIMPRQTGKTWAAIADNTWGYQFVTGYRMLHFNKSQTDANDNLRRVRDAVQLLPKYLQHSSVDILDPADKHKVTNNEKKIRNVINSVMEAMASAGNESKADAMARGRTAQKLWFDEIAYIFFNSAIYTAAVPAYEKAREIAEKNGVPYSINITTTPGDLATPHGKFAYEMMNNSIKFSEDFYDYKRKKLFDRINNTPDKTGMIFIQFNHLQLGETEDWYRERYRKMANPLKARREYLLEWINTNGNSPFDPDDVELIGNISRQRGMNVKTITLNKYFNMYQYSEYHGKKPVLIGVDVSGGLGRDSSAIVVVNPETLIPMAFFKSNMLPSDKLRKLLVTLVTRHFPHCILTIENNSVGKPLLDELRDTALNRVLYKERKKKQIDQGVNSFTKKKTKEVVEYGHNVNPTSRAQMMEMLESVVHNSHGHVAFPELYDEIQHMELRNGRIDHNSAAHDDCTMAYLGVLWIVRYGTGLKNRGIYYTLQENLDDEGVGYDTEEAFAFAQRALLDNEIHVDDEEVQSAALNQWLRNAKPVADSGTWAARERAEYYKELDRIEDIYDEDGDDDGRMEEFINGIPDSTQRLMLSNYYSMIRADSSYDPIAELLEPANSYEEARKRESWDTLYKY